MARKYQRTCSNCGKVTSSLKEGFCENCKEQKEKDSIVYNKFKDIKNNLLKD